MGIDQAPGAGHEEYEAAAVKELLTLRGAVLDLLLTERQLEQQQAQLQSQVSGYEQLARQDTSGQTASSTLGRVAALRSQLASIQEQLERTRAEREALSQRQQQAQERVDALRAAQARGMSDKALPGIVSLPARRRARKARRIMIGFSLLAIILVTALSLTGVIRLPFLHPAQQVGNKISNAPVFTPLSDAPFSRACLNAFSAPCYSPEDMQQAFRLNALYRQGYEGTGQTIVILGAGHTTSLTSDLHQFDLAWGLPDPTFQILQPQGPPAPYTCSGGIDGLETENTLDVEWAHAIAPRASIVLVIGSNTPPDSAEGVCSFVGIQDALNYAITNHLGQVISMSYGGSELGTIADTAADKQAEQEYYRAGHAMLQTAASEQITVIASAGDTGVTNPNDTENPDSYWKTPNISWPASDPDVLAVGGTMLTVNEETGDYASEHVWNEEGAATGGGLSQVFAEPDYQKSVLQQAILQGQRGIPDVAFPSADFLIYQPDTSGPLGQLQPTWRHWAVIGGTSASAPCWAGLIALANQMRGKPLGFVQPALYSLQGKGLHDITEGNNSFAGVKGYSAQKGYDLVSGWGTPIADQLVPALVQAANRLQQNSSSPTRSRSLGHARRRRSAPAAPALPPPGC
jgi:type II secretory pathway pseudopilin PulG